MATARARFVAGRSLVTRGAVVVALGLLGLALVRPAVLAAPNRQASSPEQVVTSFLTTLQQSSVDSGAALPYLSPRLRAQVQSPDALLALIGSPGGFAHCPTPLKSFSVALAQVVGASATVTATLVYTMPTGLQASGCTSPPSPGQVTVAQTFTLLLENGTWQIDASAAAATPPTATPPAVPHDNHYFAQTGYRIDNATIWDYFTHRGGLTTFGYPTSRTFTFEGFTVQFFQRRVVQLDQQGQARLLNLLDLGGPLPYTSFNGSTVPGVDTLLVGNSPPPFDQPTFLAWVRQHAPDTFDGQPVQFYQTFANTVSAQTAFPNGDHASLLPGIDLELWGAPTSQPTVDPNNHGFIYLRWQRGVMLYDASTGLTQGLLLADYMKDVLTGQHLPADLAQEAANSPLFQQYDPSQPNWVRNPSLLPGTNMTDAFTQE